jgi:hypothetical protein
MDERERERRRRATIVQRARISTTARREAERHEKEGRRNEAATLYLHGMAFAAGAERAWLFAAAARCWA